jgi:hypothetical protein
MRCIVFFSAYGVCKKSDGRYELFKFGINSAALDGDLRFLEAIVLFDNDLQFCASSVVVIKV